MKRILKCVLVFLLTINCLSQEKQKKNNSHNLTDNNMPYSALFKQGDYGYACFRIPAIVVTNNGTVLAFAEARKNGCSDTGNIDLVMRRSTDNGQTWGELQLIWDDGNNVCGNPAPVVDIETGAIHLLTTWNSGEDHESEIIAGTSVFSREVFHQISVDNGESWSQQKKITNSVKLPNWTWYATGPVHGIQMQKGKYKGRLVIPSDHIEAVSKKYYSHVFYSDDHGNTWQLGGTTPNDKVNECSVAELENGDLILNMRNYERTEFQARQVTISKDGGLTWRNQYIDKGLPEPRCQGAILNIMKKGKNILLFSNPSHSNSRINMTVSISSDDGQTWDDKVSIYKGPSAYSDLVQLKDGKILILFEGGKINPYEGIYYKVIEIN